MGQLFARSCLVPLLLSALLWGCVPPAGAGTAFENCKKCENCIFNGQSWSCEDEPGRVVVEDHNADRRALGFWVTVILVSFAVVSVVLRMGLFGKRYCPRCNRRDGMERHGVSDRNPFSGKVQWVCKYCRYVQWREVL